MAIRTPCEDDPELFFPISTVGPSVLQIEQAKAVCRDCRVQVACLRWAIDSGQNDGIWGGELFPLPRNGPVAPPSCVTAPTKDRRRLRATIDPAKVDQLTRAGRSRTEIARELGVKPDSVDRALQRARHTVPDSVAQAS